MASGAEVIATKFLHAAGYHVPENYLATIRREDAADRSETAQVIEDGRKRAMRPWDIDTVLGKSARNADGSYRVLASKALDGRAVGPFRYYGTRPDDPNDIFPHEHRRELRGLSVLAAWLNHDDSRAINTLDTLVPQGGRTVVRHHLIDFGSTFGSGSTRSQSTRAGNEFLWESRPALITMLTLGFYVRPWLKVDYPDIPSSRPVREQPTSGPRTGSRSTPTPRSPTPGPRTGSGRRASSRPSATSRSGRSSAPPGSPSRARRTT